MRLLVCGARNWSNRERIYGVLDFIGPDHIIEGESLGADTIAREWAIDRGVPFTPFPADWKVHYKAAGPIRNHQMLHEGKPDIVLAFHNDLSKSKGTKDCIYQALAAGLPIRVRGELW